MSSLSNIFFKVKALSLTSANSGSMPERSTVDGIINKLSIDVFFIDWSIEVFPDSTS